MPPQAPPGESTITGSFPHGWPAPASSRASSTASRTNTASTSRSDPVHVHDFHATILHLMGLDHERLTFRHSGRDYRLTDVAGKVVRGVLAS